MKVNKDTYSPLTVEKLDKILKEIFFDVGSDEDNSKSHIFLGGKTIKSLGKEKVVGISEVYDLYTDTEGYDMLNKMFKDEK